MGWVDLVDSPLPVRVLANGRVEQLAVAQLQHHGMLHILTIELFVVVRDWIGAILRVLVLAAMLKRAIVDGQSHTSRSSGRRLVAVGEVFFQLVIRTNGDDHQVDAISR
jgi:hypothetical protein